MFRGIFSLNDAGSEGAGIYSEQSDTIVVNCTFTDNDSADDGGALYNDNSDPVLINNILWDNYAAGDANEIYNSFSDPNISNCCIQDCGGSGGGWNTSLGSDGGGNIESDPQFIKADDLDGSDNALGTLDDGMRILAASSCTNAADDSNAPSVDIIGLSRISTADIGAFEAGHDYDEDGVPDEWEILYGLDLRDGADDTLDSDGDGLTNLEEYQIGTNPNSSDTDGDYLPDGWENSNWLDPTDANGVNGTNGDLDSDGVTNLEEYQYDLDPNSDNNGQSVTLYDYDAAGQVIVEQEVEVIGGNIFVYDTRTEYDILGRQQAERG